MITPNKRLQQILEHNSKLRAEYSTANDVVRRWINLYVNLDAKGKKTTATYLKAYIQRMN